MNYWKNIKTKINGNLHAFLFYVEFVFPGYLGMSVDYIIKLLSPDSLRDFLFYAELASPLFGFCSLFNYQLAFSRPSAWLPLLRGTHVSRLFGIRLFNYQIAFSRPSACLPLIEDEIYDFIYFASPKRDFWIRPCVRMLIVEAAYTRAAHKFYASWKQSYEKVRARLIFCSHL